MLGIDFTAMIKSVDKQGEGSCSLHRKGEKCVHRSKVDSWETSVEWSIILKWVCRHYAGARVCELNSSGSR